MKTALVLLLVVLTFEASGQALDPLPTNCHLLSRKASAFGAKSAPPPNYEAMRVIQKSDVACFGDTVVIDSPIYSNGGDVLIWADQLIVNESIDTRVHFEHSNFNASAPRKSTDGNQTISHDGAFDFLQQNNPAAGTVYRNSFSEYYTACVDCRRKGLMPQLPSGLIPTYTRTGNPTNDQQDGLPPPDGAIDFVATRSGNITIIAKRIIVRKDLDGTNLADPLACPTPQLLQRFAFNVSGLRGGRGGAGTRSSCLSGALPATPNLGRCAPGDDSGHIGPGGRGGDAGSVKFLLIGGASSDDRVALSKATSARGGAPGISTKFRTPTSGGALAATGNYCDFFRMSDGDWPKAQAGADGVLVFGKLNSNEALAEVASNLRNRGARGDYDYAELVARSKTDPRIVTATFEEFFVRSLAVTLGSAQAKAANALEQLLAQSTEPTDPLLPTYLQDLSTQELEQTPLSKLQLVYLRELNAFSIPHATISGGGFGTVSNGSGAIIVGEAAIKLSPIASYFMQSGGLLNIASRDSYSRFVAESTRLDIVSQREQLERLSEQLRDIARTVAEIDIRQDIFTKKTELDALQRQIERVEQIIQQKSGLPWIGRVLDGTKELGAAAAALYAAYNEGQVLGVLESSSKLLSAYDRLDAVWKSEGGGSQELESLKLEMRRLTAAFSAYVNAAAARRSKYESAELYGLRAAFAVRAGYTQRLDTRYAQFHDLVRLAFLSYILDLSSDVRVLRNNLTGVRVFVEDFPLVEPYFRFASSSGACRTAQGTIATKGQGIQCLRVAPSRDRRVVLWRVKLSNSTTLVPLYVLSATDSDLVLPVYGLPFELIPYRN